MGDEIKINGQSYDIGSLPKEGIKKPKDFKDGSNEVQLYQVLAGKGGDTKKVDKEDFQSIIKEYDKDGNGLDENELQTLLSDNKISMSADKVKEFFATMLKPFLKTEAPAPDAGADADGAADGAENAGTVDPQKAKQAMRTFFESSSEMICEDPTKATRPIKGKVEIVNKNLADEEGRPMAIKITDKTVNKGGNEYVFLLQNDGTYKCVARNKKASVEPVSVYQLVPDDKGGFKLTEIQESAGYGKGLKFGKEDFDIDKVLNGIENPDSVEETEETEETETVTAKTNEDAKKAGDDLADELYGSTSDENWNNAVELTKGLNKDNIMSFLAGFDSDFNVLGNEFFEQMSKESVKGNENQTNARDTVYKNVAGALLKNMEDAGVKENFPDEVALLNKLISDKPEDKELSTEDAKKLDKMVFGSFGLIQNSVDPAKNGTKAGNDAADMLGGYTSDSNWEDLYYETGTVTDKNVKEFLREYESDKGWGWQDLFFKQMSSEDVDGNDLKEKCRTQVYKNIARALVNQMQNEGTASKFPEETKILKDMIASTEQNIKLSEADANKLDEMVFGKNGILQKGKEAAPAAGATETKPTEETKPADTKPTEETKPAETKPADTKPVNETPAPQDSSQTTPTKPENKPSLSPNKYPQDLHERGKYISNILIGPTSVAPFSSDGRDVWIAVTNTNNKKPEEFIIMLAGYEEARNGKGDPFFLQVSREGSMGTMDNGETYRHAILKSAAGQFARGLEADASKNGMENSPQVTKVKEIYQKLLDNKEITEEEAKYLDTECKKWIDLYNTNRQKK